MTDGRRGPLGRVPDGVRPEDPGPGRESVWDYPRQPEMASATVW